MSVELIFYSVCIILILLGGFILWAIVYCNHDTPTDEERINHLIEQKNEKARKN